MGTYLDILGTSDYTSNTHVEELPPMSTHHLYIGDAVEKLQELPARAAQLVVTSPPYWCIKDYDHPAQIGHQETYEGYLSRLEAVWREADRVLEPGCKVAINVGDQFLRASEHGAYSIAPIHAEIIRQFQRMKGYLYLGGIIWQKITTTKTTGGCSWMGSIYYPRDGYVTYEHEFVLLFKKNGKARGPSAEAKELSKLTKEQRSAWFRGVWDIHPTRQDEHPAAFPLELPNRLIRMFTYHGETVLDPFAGSGTTLVAAEAAGRNSIGVELNPAYGRLCQSRITGLEIRRSHAEEIEASSLQEVPRRTAQLRRKSPQPEQAARAGSVHGLDLAASAK